MSCDPLYNTKCSKFYMHLFEGIIGAFKIYIFYIPLIHRFFKEDAEILLLGNWKIKTRVTHFFCHFNHCNHCHL